MILPLQQQNPEEQTTAYLQKIFAQRCVTSTTKTTLQYRAEPLQQVKL
jgi:hypothetical protein